MTACKKQSQDSSFEATVSYVWEKVVHMHPPEFPNTFRLQRTKAGKMALNALEDHYNLSDKLAKK